MTELEKHFSNELNRFPAHLCAELTSVLAFAIIEADHHADLISFSKAIQHIANQQGLMSYSSLNKSERLCVDTFGQQVISKQEHIVFSKEDLLDTVTHLRCSCKVNRNQCPSTIVGKLRRFHIGFAFITSKLKDCLSAMVSLKTGGKND